MSIAKLMAAGGTNPLASMARIVSSVSAMPLTPNGGIHWVPSESTSVLRWDQSVSRRRCITIFTLHVDVDLYIDVDTEFHYT
jgi:hypothetical protein